MNSTFVTVPFSETGWLASNSEANEWWARRPVGCKATASSRAGKLFFMFRPLASLCGFRGFPLRRAGAAENAGHRLVAFVASVFVHQLVCDALRRDLHGPRLRERLGVV